MQKIERSHSASRGREYPSSAGLPGSQASVTTTRQPDCSVGSGFVPETRAGSGLAAARRVGLNNPERDLEDLARAHAPMGIDEPPLLRAQECSDRSDSKPRPRSSGPQDCRTPPHPRQGASPGSLALLLKPSVCRNSANPSASGDAQTAPSRDAGAVLAMLVLEAEQDRPPRSPPAGASHDTLLDHAYTGHAAVVAASLEHGWSAANPAVPRGACS